MTSTAILIPARYDSKRFPGKPLVDLGGVPMIKRVFNICKSTGLDTYVLTDDMRISHLFEERQCWIDQTKEFANGTERCAAAATDANFIKYIGNYDNFINVTDYLTDDFERIHLQTSPIWDHYYKSRTPFYVKKHNFLSRNFELLGKFHSGRFL